MKNLLMGNLKFKILAVVFAILAWIYVHAVPYPSYINFGLGTQERSINLPIQYENLSPAFKLTERTNFVELSLREESHTFMVTEQVRAIVNLAGIEAPGKYFLEIEVEKPRWMKLLNQRPKYALITVEEVN